MNPLIERLQEKLNSIEGEYKIELKELGAQFELLVDGVQILEFNPIDLDQNRINILTSKVIYQIGKAERIHARKCEVKKISKPEAETFFKENHWLGATSSKVNIGCFYVGELVAVCSFASPRKFDEEYRSGELVRFSNKNNKVVVGGLDKLIKWYAKNYPIDDVMTYVDKCWGNGEAFKNIGFVKKSSNNPMSYKYVLLLTK